MLFILVNWILCKCAVSNTLKYDDSICSIKQRKQNKTKRVCEDKKKWVSEEDNEYRNRGDICGHIQDAGCHCGCALWFPDKQFLSFPPLLEHLERWDTQRYFSLKKWLNWDYRCFTSPLSESKEKRGHYLTSLLDRFTVKHDSYGHCTATPKSIHCQAEEAHLEKQEKPC